MKKHEERALVIALCLSALGAGGGRAQVSPMAYGCEQRDLLRHDSLEEALAPGEFARYRASDDSLTAVRHRLEEVQRITGPADREVKALADTLHVLIMGMRDDADKAAQKARAKTIDALQDSLTKAVQRFKESVRAAGARPGDLENRMNFFFDEDTIALHHMQAMASLREPIPAPGMDACQVLRDRGEPTRVTRTAAAGGYQSASWWYEEHLVTLRPDAHGRWWVDTVVW